MKRFVAVLVAFSLILSSCSTTEPVSTPYDNSKFPQWSKTLRREETILFGTTALAYPIINLFVQDKIVDNQIGDFALKFGISAGVGLVVAIADFIINLVKGEKPVASDNNRIRDFTNIKGTAPKIDNITYSIKVTHLKEKNEV